MLLGFEVHNKSARSMQLSTFLIYKGRAKHWQVDQNPNANWREL